MEELKGEILWIKGGITAPKGFLAAGVRAGIKSQGLDLGLLYSEAPASAAALFTTNRVKAAPVMVSMEHLQNLSAQAIVVNSGNANACTGEQGKADAHRMAQTVAQELKIAPQEVLVASTGVIGRLLPMEEVVRGIREAVRTLSPEGGEAFAEAIITTDTRPKSVAAEVVIEGQTVRIGGCAKGAGMIAPDLATMLCFLTTDANIEPLLLRKILQEAVDQSFHCLTVDGDTSTNDSVFILANGRSSAPPLEESSLDLKVFRKALTEVCVALARELARDGEGATKLIEVKVEGARNDREARWVAQTIANSNLVKTAIFGKDPNWGRIIAAAGRSGAYFEPERVSLYLGEHLLFRGGVPVPFNLSLVQDYLAQEEILIRLDLGQGMGSAHYFTCDFSYDYVRINAEYHT